MDTAVLVRTYDLTVTVPAATREAMSCGTRSSEIRGQILPLPIGRSSGRRSDSSRHGRICHYEFLRARRIRPRPSRLRPLGRGCLGDRFPDQVAGTGQRDRGPRRWIGLADYRRSCSTRIDWWRIAKGHDSSIPPCLQRAAIDGLLGLDFLRGTYPGRWIIDRGMPRCVVGSLAAPSAFRQMSGFRRPTHTASPSCSWSISLSCGTEYSAFEGSVSRFSPKTMN